MSASESAITADDYVVRYGLRGFRGALCGLVLWSGLASVIVVRSTGPSIPTAVALALGEVGLLAACAVEIWRAARREIVFAVSQDGVYFGPGMPRDGQLAEAVPWEQISAIELFTEKVPVRGIRSSYRCVGVLVREDAGPAGSGPGLHGNQAHGSRAGGSVLEADRTGRTGRSSEGSVSGVLFAYRRMSGWRVNRGRLSAAVRQYAPSVRIIGEQTIMPPWIRGQAGNLASRGPGE